MKKNFPMIRVTLLLTSSLTVMSGATIAPSLPQLKEAFATVPNIDLLVKLVLTMPAICIALGAPVAGFIIDRFGRKRLLAATTLLYGLAGASGFLLNDIYLILVGRIFLGLAVAGVMTTSTTLIGDYFTGPERNRFLGLQAAFMAIGGVVYISIGGLAADISWRAPFLIYASALLFLPLVLRFIYEPSVALATSNGPAHAQNGQATPPPQQTNTLPPTVWAIFGMSLFSMLMFYMIPVQIPFFIKSITNVSNSVIGFSIGLTMLMGSIVGLLFKKIRSRLSPMLIFTVCFLFMGVGFLIMGAAGSYAALVPGLLVSGLGGGLAVPNASLWLIDSAPMAMRGRATGGLTAAFFMGQFLSPIVFHPLVTHVGLGSSFVCGGIMLLTASLIIFLLRKTIR